MEKKENYIKVGFLFYIGFELAKTIDNKYREKVVNYIKKYIPKDNTKED